MNNIKTMKGEDIITLADLKKELHPDGQGSGTVEGTILINGVDVFVRKHWSYEGGYPFKSQDGSVTGELYTQKLANLYRTPQATRVDDNEELYII